MSYTNLPPRSRDTRRPSVSTSSSSSAYDAGRAPSGGRGQYLQHDPEASPERIYSFENQSSGSSYSSGDNDTRNGFLDSNATLNGANANSVSETEKRGSKDNYTPGSNDMQMHRRIGFADNGKGPRADDSNERNGQPQCDLGNRDDKHKGMFANLLELYGIDHQEHQNQLRQQSKAPEDRPWHLRRIDSLASDDSQVLDPDDPLITGERKMLLDDAEDLERACLRQMNYKARQKYRDRIRIEFNITCKADFYARELMLTSCLAVLNRQTFLMRLAKSLLTFGAPSHRIEGQLLSAARILEIDGEFIHFPGVIICSFGDPDTKTSETHFVKCGGRLSLGSLHEIHQIYRSVVHDEISAKKATARLDVLLNAPPLYGGITRCILAFWLSALICVLAFGGSFLDMWIAGLGAVCLSLLQINFAAKSQLYANVFEYVFCLSPCCEELKICSHTGSLSRSSYRSFPVALAAFVARSSATLLYLPQELLASFLAT